MPVDCGYPLANDIFAAWATNAFTSSACSSVIASGLGIEIIACSTMSPEAWRASAMCLHRHTSAPRLFSSLLLRPRLLASSFGLLPLSMVLTSPVGSSCQGLDGESCAWTWTHSRCDRALRTCRRGGRHRWCGRCRPFWTGSSIVFLSASMTLSADGKSVDGTFIDGADGLSIPLIAD